MVQLVRVNGLMGPRRRAFKPPVNTVAPVASGTNEVGETLSCTTGTWTGTAPISYTYQWRRDGSNIGSATASTYLLVSADAETDVDCVVTATNVSGTASADSNNITIAAEGDGSLSDVLASTVFDLDATKSASYSGSGTTWSNLVTAPADGSAQTAYDFETGDGSTSTTYPTFNGAAGSAAAYWSVDGGDYLRSKSQRQGIFNTAHKTTGGVDHWFAFTFRTPDSITATQYLFGTSATFSASTIGVGIRFPSTGAASYRQLGDTAGVNAALGTLSAATDYILIVSHSHSGNATRVWLNTATNTQVSHTFNATTSSTSATRTILGGAYTSAGSISQPAESTTRYYGFYGGNEYLDNTKAGAIIAALEARHGRDYTP